MLQLGDIVQGVIRADSGKTLKGPDIIKFIESRWGLNRSGDVEPFPVQRVILKTYYGIPLDENLKVIEVRNWMGQKIHTLSEADYLRFLYDDGRCNVREVLEGGFQDLCLAIGRRSGKTLMASWITAFETDKVLQKDNPHAYYGISRSDEIKLIAVATGKDQAAILYNAVSSHFLECERFGPYRANSTQSNAKFQTISDIEQSGRHGESDLARASINVTFYSCVAKGLRGGGCLLSVLDEIAHFVSSGQSSAEEVYTAVSPARAAFTPKNPENRSETIGPSEGRIIMISSPLGKEGFFYDKFEQGFRHMDLGRLCISAPTWEVNPTVPPEEFKRHFLSDPKKFWTEFGAQFTDRRRGWIDNEQDLIDCIDKNLKPAKAGRSRVVYYMGMDVGVTKDGDSTAIAIGHLDDEGVIVLDLLVEMRAGEGDYADQERLEFEQIADKVHELSRTFYISEGMFDSWSGIPLEQSLSKKGLKQIKSVAIKPEFESRIWKNFKDMLFAQKIRLYNWPVDPDKRHCPYIDELLELQEEWRSKYIVIVQAPKVRGKHDDRSDAIARMIWLASQKLGKKGYIAKKRGAKEVDLAAISRHQRLGRRKALLGGSHPSRQIPPIRRR